MCGGGGRTGRLCFAEIWASTQTVRAPPLRAKTPERNFTVILSVLLLYACDFFLGQSNFSNIILGFSEKEQRSSGSTVPVPVGAFALHCYVRMYMCQSQSKRNNRSSINMWGLYFLCVSDCEIDARFGNFALS